MRVISGSARGCALYAPQGANTRPTLDRVKEAVFGALQFDIAGASVLDIFAGSGALGIEALSRGAKECVFVDSSSRSVQLIELNLEKTRLSRQARVIKQDFEKALASLTGEKFSLAFLDPPYGAGLYEKALGLLLERDLLCGGAKVVCEHSAEGGFGYNGYKAVKTKKYGNTRITFLERTI